MEQAHFHTEMQEPSAQNEPAPQPSEKPSSGILRRAVRAFGLYLYHYSWVMLLAATVLIIAYYVWFPSRYYFHSDTTDTLMWAAASYDAGELFNREFAYACLLPFNTSLIMTALIPLFGVTMTTHVLGMLLFLLLFTAALMWFLRTMNWSWKWISVGVFVELMVLSGSEKLREIFWGHTIYYSISVLFLFVGLGLVFRQMDLARAAESSAKAGRRLMTVMILLGIWFFLTSMNQLNAMTIFALPVMAAVFLERFLDTESPLLCRKNFRILRLLVVMGACMILGYYLTVVLSHGIRAGYAEAYSSYSGMQEWVKNLFKFPEHWFSLLGVTAQDRDPFLSETSIVNLLLILTSLILLVMPLVGLCNYYRIEDGKLRLLILTYWCMTALIMLGYVCGRLSSANWRLSPIAAMAAVVTVAVIRWAVPHIRLQRITAAAMIPVVLVCMINAVTILKMPINGYQEALLYRLADGLEERGLNYGYATFWQANGITVVSDSAVKCRNVSIDENGITPYVYQSSASWFYDQPGQKQYFLLMSEQERNLLRLMQHPVADLKSEEFELYEFYVWVFDENIFDEKPDDFPLPEDILESIRAARHNG